jgi:SRSO17 transposase
MQPIAAATHPEVAPDRAAYERLQHFITYGVWEVDAFETALAHVAAHMLGGPDAVLIVDDTVLMKRGTHSVGVGRQYAGEVGHLANCQALVSLTLARDDVPLPIALRLYLPGMWTKDDERSQARRVAAGVPDTAWQRPADAWAPPATPRPKLGRSARAKPQSDWARGRKAPSTAWTKWELAVLEIDRVRVAGVMFGAVVGDAE